MPEPTPTPEADSPAPAALIRLALHRRVTVTAVGEEPILLERKQAALMAYLHYAGMTPRGRLAALLWPQASASGARSNLRQCLARLRRIAPGVVAESFEAVGLAPHLAVEQLEDGRAELLEAHDYADCDDFERWLRERNDAMRAQLKATQIDAVRAAIDHGDFSEAQARAEALLTFDHESEDAYRALMEVAYLRGDFAAGVRAWGRCRDMLREFYGVAPSKATQTLGSAILAAAPAIPIEPAGEPGPDLTPANRRDRWSAPDASAHTAGQPMLPSGRGNLSLTPAPLYGRSAELAALVSALHLHRLVTLIGIGGIGKTSLALAAAHAERERWPEGVWFVDLAPLRDADSVAVATAHVLGLTLASHRSPADELVLALRASSILLVLDNAEHLSEAVASLTAALLVGTPHLRLLVTSRQALRVADEQRFPLSGLSAPTDPGLSDLQRHGALALFEARVSALDPSFRLTAGNATAVAEVCRRLDGLPLAIELAAARVPVLGLDGLRSRLHESLRVLGAAAKISAPRHQTLSATFDWTYALLAPEEQTLLRRLALFVGGFSLKLAEEVSCGYDDGLDSKTARDWRDAWSLLDTLSALIDKSLVVVTVTDAPRYRLLEVTRTYALQKLIESGEFDRLSQRHANAVWRIFAEAEADLNEKTTGALTRGQFLRRLTPELENLRTARAWSRTSASDHLIAIGLAATSVEALRLLGLSAEALSTMLALRDVVDPAMPADTVEMFWTGLCALGTHGRLSRNEMMETIERAQLLYRRCGSARRIHVGLYRKGFALLHLGILDDAERAVSEMERLEQRDWPARAVALRLNLQGVVEGALGRFDAAIASFVTATALLEFEPDESDVVLNILSNMCLSLIGAERNEEALSIAQDVLCQNPSPVVRNLAQRATMVALVFLGRLDEAVGISRQEMSAWCNDDMLPHMLSVFAWLAYLQGRLADAIRLDGAARDRVSRMGLSNSPVFARARSNLEHAVAELTLPHSDISLWRLQGERLREDDLVAMCIGEQLGTDSTHARA